ncbi:MAG TPA: DUF4838 domain-containing protein [Opitutales bacterium]|nr:DUF4838 domain-containing protein [Opitutales bacterium]
MIRHLKSLLFAAVLAWAGASDRLRADPLPLLPANTVVVIGKNADKNEHDAAAMLQTWLRKASTSTTGFDIKSDGNAVDWKDKTALAVGHTSLTSPDPRLAELNDDGFVIHGNGPVISIAGHTSNATYYAAVSFLDRYAGVRFYMPGELWTSLPANHEAAFDGNDFVSQPFVVSGFITGISTRALGDDDWERRIGGLRRKGGTHQHDLWTIFPADKLAATQPEIYPIYNGQRYIPKDASDQGWQADFTEPATLETAKESITDYFQANPAAEYIAVSINDNYRWSESEKNQQIIDEFKAKDPKGDYKLEATSDIYWRFMNQLAAWLAEKFPSKMLVGLAYGPTRGVPAFKLAGNIVAFAVLHVAEPPEPMPAPGQLSFLDQWLAAAAHFSNHDWYEGDGYLLPRIYSDLWSQFLRSLSARESSAYMHAEAYPNWGFDGPKIYVMAKMWWNPQADPRALTRQFCADMFGPAAQPMDAYFLELEALWMQLDYVDGPRRKLNLWSNQFVTTPVSRAMIQRCHDLLAQAGNLAQTDDQKKRVALFAQCFAFSESLFALAEKPADEGLYTHAVALADELSKNKWAFYNPAKPLQAIQALYKGPAKK